MDRSLNRLPAAVARGLMAVLTDIDDTLTHDGLLPPAAYAALQRLADEGLAVVPITGRPAGWCDMIARLWPVSGVIGENGALYFSYDRPARRMRRRFMQSEGERHAHREALREIERRILEAVPGAATSADQGYRETDLAIDFCEDVEPLLPASVTRIVEIFEQAGATAKVSSIHVNGWFGDYDKLAMTRLFFSEVLGRDLDDVREQVVFCGDSPNDAPMFGYFPHACGVANVHAFAASLKAWPAYVAVGEGGAGFVEIADTILSLRSA
jgi:HAD superfamily hydrolase (TIGR01484 family)